jgi:hypothetical protein
MYHKCFKEVDVLTATPLEQFKQSKSITYKVVTKTEVSFFERIPKLAALPAYLNGLNFTGRRIVKNWTVEIESKLRNKKYDLVVSLGSGLSFVPAIAMLNIQENLYGKYLMFVHDPYPSHQYPPPYQKKSTYLYKVQAKLFGKSLYKADIISLPSQRLLEWMSQYYNLSASNCVVQPHLGLTIDELSTILPKEVTTKLPIYPKGLNIVHTGTLLGPRNPMYLLNTLERLYTDYPEAKSEVFLHIIGKMTKEWSEQDLIRENVYIYPERFSYLSSLKLQQQASVLLLLEAHSNVSPFMPGKLADYLMAKKPILALTPNKSETTRILGNDYPLLAENGDVEKIYEKLLLI